jgi:hypothetical protein
VIALNIGNIRPGSVERGFEYGRGRGVLDRWEARFQVWRKTDDACGILYKLVKTDIRVLILPRMIDPLEEHLHDGRVYQRDDMNPSTFTVTYRRLDA